MEVVTLTPSQLQLWKSQTLTPDAALFNQIMTADLNIDQPQRLVFEAMNTAWQYLQQRHRILGSTIQSDESLNVVQRYDDQVRTMSFIDLSMQPELSECAWTSWLKHRGQCALELQTALTDAALVRRSQHNYTLFLNLHHLIVDAISARLLVEELIEEFHSRHGGNAQQHESVKKATNNDADFLAYARSLERTLNAEEQSADSANGTISDGDQSEPLNQNKVAAPSAESSAGDSSHEETRIAVFYGGANISPNTLSIRVPLKLSSEQLAAIKELSCAAPLQQLNTNLFHLCFYATALVLYVHKATGDSTIVVEAPVAGRFSPQQKKLIGNFIEMLRITIQIDSSATLLSLYNNVRDALFRELQQAHSGCTSKLTPSRVHGVINLVRHERSHNDAPPIAMQWHHSGHHDAHHPLRLHIADWNLSGEPELSLDINQSFFKGIPATHPADHLECACDWMSGDLTVPVERINLVGDNDCWKFHGEKNPEFLHTLALTDCFDRIVEAQPDAIAVYDDSRQWSYAELNRLSERFEQLCRQHAVQAGDRVLVSVRRTIYLPALLLGILRAGACYIPMDASNPGNRVSHVAQDANASLIVVDAGSALLQDQKIKTVDFCSWQQNCAELIRKPVSEVSGQHNPRSENSTVIVANTEKQSERNKSISQYSLESTAYLIYTSGSTGNPKGVIVSHRALMAYLSWAMEYYKTDIPVVMPLFTSISFDMTVTSIFLPLITGGTLRVFGEAAVNDVHVSDNPTIDPMTDLQRVLSDKQINTVKLTPSHLALIGLQNVRNQNITQLIIGGEDLKYRTVKEIRPHFRASLRIVNEYGPSEATVGCIAYEDNGDFEGPSVPIGKPICRTSAYVLNDKAQPQFEGAVGELYLAGCSLADGYWNNADQTAKAFITLPDITEQRLYRTGDLVKVVNRQLVYLGRQDSQIKRNGYRIELTEIESALSRHADILDCAVVVADVQENATSKAVTADFSTGMAGQQTIEQHCVRCGLSSLHPDAHIDAEGICGLCMNYETNEQRIQQYFKSTDELQVLVKDIKVRRQGDYDALVLLSGGKDSTYALTRLVDMGLQVYAFSLDNGYISDQAKENIDRVCQQLNVDHHYASTPSMDAIFNDSLTRYSNVCHGCFKTIYTLSLAFAEKHKISTIFTGLSRGQFFETRLNNELFADPSLPLSSIDAMVQQARLQYHAVEDAPNRLLNIESVNDGTLPSKIAIEDFYRYCHVELNDMIEYLETRVNWIRPADTGRSTNCLINDVGIHVHKLEKGFHNYALPYSWDVRLGHKQRDEALEELDDAIDIQKTEHILSKVDYQPLITSSVSKSTVLHAFFKADKSLDENLLISWMETQLPPYMLPNRIISLISLPLNENGKVDRKLLSQYTGNTSEYEADKLPEPLNKTEKHIADLWKRYLRVPVIGKTDHFFKLGGDSLSAIRCVVELRHSGYELEPAELFRYPELHRFSQRVDTVGGNSRPIRTPGTERFSALNDQQRSKLQRLLKKSSAASSE